MFIAVRFSLFVNLTRDIHLNCIRASRPIDAITNQSLAILSYPILSLGAYPNMNSLNGQELSKKQRKKTQPLVFVCPMCDQAQGSVSNFACPPPPGEIDDTFTPFSG